MTGAERLLLILFTIVFVAAVATIYAAFQLTVDLTQLRQGHLTPAEARALAQSVATHLEWDFVLNLIGTGIIVVYGTLIAFFARYALARHRVEKRRDAQYAVTRLLQTGESMKEVAPAVLKELTLISGWRAAVLWETDQQQRLMRVLGRWPDDGTTSFSLAADACAGVLERGKGLPGRVWASGQSEFTTDVKSETGVLLQDGGKTGKDFCSAFAFPIRNAQNVVAVLEFFNFEVKKPDRDLFELLENSGSQLGQSMAREKTRAKLQENEARFRALFEALPLILWTANEDGQLQYFNNRWFEYTGLTAEQSYEGAWQLLVHPEDLPEYLERWKSAVADGHTFEAEFRLKRALGLSQEDSFRKHLARAVGVRGVEGQVVQWFGTWTDIDGVLSPRG